MTSFQSPVDGKIIVIHLGKGELLLESICSELARLGVKNAVVLSAIGSLRKTVLHIITTTDAVSTDQFMTLEKPMEIGAVQGMLLDGEAHFHIVCSDPDRAYTGHLEPGCEVQYLAEISLMELADTGLTRKKDENGISYIAQR